MSVRTMSKKKSPLFGLAVIGVALVTLTGCSPIDDAPSTEPAEPESGVSVTPEPSQAESVEAAEARTCVEGSWVADNASYAATMFEGGAIAAAEIHGTWRLIAEADGFLRSEFIDWSYDVNLPGPLGTPMIRQTITTNSTTIGYFTVQPGGLIEGILDTNPTDDSADPPEPLVLTCTGDTLTQEVLGGIAVHVRQ